jgi:hypothetical protein
VGIDNLIEKEALPPVRAFGASFTGLDDVESGSGCAVRRGKREFLNSRRVEPFLRVRSSDVSSCDNLIAYEYEYEYSIAITRDMK